MRLRLKADILREAARYGGLVQVQEEVDNDGEITKWHARLSQADQAMYGSASESGMSPTWIAASSGNVMTMKELWQSLKDEGFNFEVNCLPITGTLAPS